jgi:hypothetical protein
LAIIDFNGDPCGNRAAAMAFIVAARLVELMPHERSRRFTKANAGKKVMKQIRQGGIIF